jgi:hypothetical protein
MAIDRHVELAPSGIVLSLAKDRRKQEETFSSSATLPWECEPDVQATTRVRRRAPFGGAQEAILPRHGPLGYGCGDPALRPPVRVATRAGRSSQNRQTLQGIANTWRGANGLI